MQKYNFVGKKIGIWGAGIVGQSAINFFLQNACNIQLLNKNFVANLDPKITQLLQEEKNIKTFFETNDYILASPGIPLHDFEEFHHKIITELDIMQQEYKKPIIAITGTVGKTTITHILQKTLNRFRKTIAAGNIGYPMLNLLNKDHEEEQAVIEVSSFQLQHTKQFAPDLAIITNFYKNHLDYHKTEAEYFEAKTKIFQFQKQDQKRLVCTEIASKAAAKSQTFLCGEKPLKEKESSNFYIENNKIIFVNKFIKVELANLDFLPSYTFPQNWLIIIAALYLNDIIINSELYDFFHTITLPQHRLAPIYTINGTTWYNDSKSTIWQSTAQAMLQVEKPLALFLGGLSKGVDRTPLIEKIKEIKDVTVFAFGKEADQIKQICKGKNVPVFSAATLEESFTQCMKNIEGKRSILFSPAGSSFDLFKNYSDRGQVFEQLAQEYFIKSNPNHSKF
jgi:UDP-N-acetylmuramoylalanine--D-glutamate ligase